LKKHCIVFFVSIRIAEEIGSRTLAINDYYEYYITPLGKYETGLRFMQEGLMNAQEDGNDALVETYLKKIEDILFDLGQYTEKIELSQKYAMGSIFGHTGKLSEVSFDGLCQFLFGHYESGLHVMQAACEQLNSLNAIFFYAWALLRIAFAKSFREDQSGWLDGLDDANQALSIFRKTSNGLAQVITLSTTARLHLKLGQVKEAVPSSTEAVGVSEEKRVFRFRELYLLTHAQALRATGRDEEADSYLQSAFDRVMLVAGNTKDDDLRQSYLQNVPWNREILKEAKKRGITAE